MKLRSDRNSELYGKGDEPEIESQWIASILIAILRPRTTPYRLVVDMKFQNCSSDSVWHLFEILTPNNEKFVYIYAKRKIIGVRGKTKEEKEREKNIFAGFLEPRCTCNFFPAACRHGMHVLSLSPQVPQECVTDTIFITQVMHSRFKLILPIMSWVLLQQC